MRSRVRLSLVVVIALAGCGDGASSPPPFDEMPLRDALRAEPEVVAALAEPARARLAARLDAARTGDATSDQIEDDGVGPAALVAALDRARESGRRDPLVVGAVTGAVAQPLATDAQPQAARAPAPLPDLEGAPAGATAALEARALSGAAGASVRGLLAASGAHHLVRVVGWPVGAVVIGDAVYVNASWLAALAAPAADGGVDAEAAPPSSLGAAASGWVSGASAQAAGPDPDGGQPAGAGPPAAIETRRTALSYDSSPDAGAPTASPSFWDTCASCSGACASSDTSDDSCDSSGDSGDACASSTDGSDGSSAGSCSGSGSDGTDSSAGSCSSTPDDGSGGGCQVARGAGGERSKNPHRLPWLLAPLCFLLFRRRDP